MYLPQRSDIFKEYIVYFKGTIVTLFTLPTALLYVFSALLIVITILRNKNVSYRTLYSLSSVALLMHAFSIDTEALFYAQYVSISSVGVALWFIISFILTLTAVRSENLLLLPIAYLVSSGTLLWNATSTNAMSIDVISSPAIGMHIGVSLLTFSATLLASFYALQVQGINYLLKRRLSFAINKWVPPLMQVEKVLFNLIAFATLLLTLSLISGFVFSDTFFADGSRHKTLLSLVSWVIFITVLIARFGYHIRGKRLTGATIIATLTLSLAYFGSRFVQEIILTAV